MISGPHLERSVLGPWAKIESGAHVVDSVVFERAIIEPNAFVGRAILDKDVVVAAGATIGVDPDAGPCARLHRDRLRHHRRRQGSTRRSMSACALPPPAPSARFLVVLDADSTLIHDEVIELLAEEAGSRTEVAEITERAMRGELDFEQSLRERVQTLAGLPVAVFEHVGERIRVTDGVPELVAGVHAGGGRGRRRLRGLPRDARPAGRAPRSRPLAGQPARGRRRPAHRRAWSGDVIDAAPRRPRSREWAACAGIPPRRTVAIGDGANDLRMMAVAGLSVAFNAKPRVRRRPNS